jgi:hypothetical protein
MITFYTSYTIDLRNQKNPDLHATVPFEAMLVDIARY